jgi:hypothetical protein
MYEMPEHLDNSDIRALIGTLDEIMVKMVRTQNFLANAPSAKLPSGWQDVDEITDLEKNLNGIIMSLEGMKKYAETVRTMRIAVPEL